MSEKKSKGGGGKIILVLLILFVIVPLLATTALYFLFPSFKTTANGVLSNLPGPAGSYFSSMPTEQEVTDKINSIAEYLLKVDVSRAVDKLTIIKKDDSNMYDAIVRTMLRINPNATKGIVEALRANSLSKDAAASTLEQIKKEQEDDYSKKAKFLEGLSVNTAVEEVNFLVGNSVNGFREVAKTLNYMDPIVAAKIMEKIPSDVFKKIINVMDAEKAALVRTEMTNRKTNLLSLGNTAQILSSQDIKKLVVTLGNTNTYKLDELALIFINLGPIKTGKVLAGVQDDKFVNEVISAIKNKRIEDTGKDEITKDILKTLKIYKEFDDNVNELVTIYEKMKTDTVATNIQTMMKNNSSPKIYTLDNGENIVITDEDLALAILTKFTNKKIGDILSIVDPVLSSELTRKLALPKN